MNAEGKDIISLAIGSPDMPPSEQTIEKLCEVAHQPNAHGYQPTMGTPELREENASGVVFDKFLSVNAYERFSLGFGYDINKNLSIGIHANLLNGVASACLDDERNRRRGRLCPQLLSRLFLDAVGGQGWRYQFHCALRESRGPDE